MIEAQSVVLAAFLLSFLLPVLIFSLYGLIILSKGKRENLFLNKNMLFQPNVTVVVPTHNEEHIISEKIQNILMSKYPIDKLELIFVDDSDDLTPEIIERHSESNPAIRLFHFNERMGYSPSMLFGTHAAKGEIVVLTDAHSFFDENTIGYLVRNFEDPEIGAVTGTSTILNPEAELAQSENLYLTLYNKMRIAETNIDSTFWFKGEAAAVRRNLIEDLEECNATFDTTIALYSRSKGYRSIFDPDVHFYEHAPTSHGDRVKQKTIRAANIIKILFYFKEFILNPKYGKFGMLIYPMNFFMVVITPLLILLNLILLFPLLILNLNLTLQIIGAYFIVTFLITIMYRPLIVTFIQFSYSLIKALYQIFFTRIEHDKVEKLMSTRKAP